MSGINDQILRSFWEPNLCTAEPLTVEKLRRAREALRSQEIAPYYVCIVECYRRPRSKRRRIRKKWAMDLRNWRSRWVLPHEVPAGTPELPLSDPRNHL